jgi:hypothetical protein
MSAELAAWQQATNALVSATADIMAGRDVAAARTRATAAISAGTAAIQRWVNMGGTASAVPYQTQVNWQTALEQYARANSGAVSSIPATGGLRIGNIVLPWTTVAIIAAAVGFGVWWFWFRKGRR